jgi:RNA polymerase primary sigma factor
MSIKDLIAAAFNKDANAFESAFSSAMKEKVGAAIDSRFLTREELELDEAKDEEDDEDENGDTSSEEDNDDEDEEDMKEEAEELDELSKKTLGSYISKASDNAATHAVKYGQKKAEADEMDRLMNRHMSYSDKDKVRSIMKTTSDDVDAPRRKAAQRLSGIDTAVKKLSK